MMSDLRNIVTRENELVAETSAIDRAYPLPRYLDTSQLLQCRPWRRPMNRHDTLIVMLEDFVIRHHHDFRI
jgi:hypothetical protein